jgi:exonuclease III
MLQHRAATGLYRMDSNKNMKRERKDWNGKIDVNHIRSFWTELYKNLALLRCRSQNPCLINNLTRCNLYLMLLFGLITMVAHFEDPNIVPEKECPHIHTYGEGLRANRTTSYPYMYNSYLLDQCGDIHPHPGPAVRYSTIKCLSLNTQSMKKLDKTTDKLLEFRAMTDLMNPDIFTVTETWLNDNINDKDIADNETYNIYRKDRTHTNGGGVLCLVKKELWSERRKDLEIPALRHNEIIAIEFRPKAGERILLLSAYRSQTDPCKDFLSNLEQTIINATMDEIFDIIILGDLNYSQIKWTDEDNNLPPHCRDLLSFVTRWNLRQLNRNPSRKDGKSILDLVMTNTTHNFSQITSQSYEYQSDHFLLEFSIFAENTRKQPVTRRVYNFRRANSQRIKNGIRGIKLPDTNNVNQLWVSLKNRQEIQKSKTQ